MSKTFKDKQHIISSWGEFYFNGSSQANKAKLSLIEDNYSLEVFDENNRLIFTFLHKASQVKISQPIGQAPRQFSFFKTKQAHNQGINALDNANKDISWNIDNFSGGVLYLETKNIPKNLIKESSIFIHLIHKLESSWKAATLMFVACILSIFWFIQYGIPILSKPVANKVPQIIKERIDEQVLIQLKNNNYFEEPAINSFNDKIESLIFEINEQDVITKFYVYLANDKIGANAMALPGGTMIITKQFLEIGFTDNEIKAVIAHEAGHIIQNHSMRNIVQSVSTAAIISAYIGDVSAIAELILVTAPAALQNLKYSRDFEYEADEYAFKVLNKFDISEACLISALRKIEASHFDKQKLNQDNEQQSQVDLMGLLSTHPSSDKRAETLVNKTCL